MKADDERDLARSCIGWQLTRPIDSAAGCLLSLLLLGLARRARRDGGRG